MTEDTDSDVMDNLGRQQRIEARQFTRMFATADGKAVLAALKRDFGWDAAAPVPDNEGEISAARLRAWTGSRGVIAMIHSKISLGEKLSENPKQTNDEHE